MKWFLGSGLGLGLGLVVSVGVDTRIAKEMIQIKGRGRGVCRLENQRVSQVIYIQVDILGVVYVTSHQVLSQCCIVISQAASASQPQQVRAE